jgi:30S ribosomal protein S31
MGKGDRKTKRGKIIKGSYGVTRTHKKKNKEAGVHNKEKKPEKSKK